LILLEEHLTAMDNDQKTVRPKLAMCNIFSDVDRLREFAIHHGFSGIDWSFDVRTVPDTLAEESMWVKQLSALGPLEVRYHCPFYRIDLGHHDPWEVKLAEAVFRWIIRLVSNVKGEFLTIHIGLGHDSTESLSWEASIDNLARLVQYGASHRIRVCLENLARGWTSRPHLFEKLIRRTGAAVTFDIGHAHVCESVRSHHYSVEDFVTPHPDRVFNAHIYHKEVPGVGHIPPECIEDVEDCLLILQDIGCDWWALELREPDGLLRTKKVIDEYLTRSTCQAKSRRNAPWQASHPAAADEEERRVKNKSPGL
jgi:sugar phosphate isomerase/epimerase